MNVIDALYQDNIIIDSYFLIIEITNTVHSDEVIQASANTF